MKLLNVRLVGFDQKYVNELNSTTSEMGANVFFHLSEANTDGMVLIRDCMPLAEPMIEMSREFNMKNIALINCCGKKAYLQPQFDVNEHRAIINHCIAFQKAEGRV
jgi:hypothetical protein